MRKKLKEVFVSDWFDHIGRGNYQSTYINIGSRPSFVQAAGVDQIRNDFSKTLFLHRSSKAAPETDADDLVLLMAKKILCRGDVPWSTLGVEAQILREIGQSDFILPPDDNIGDIRYEASLPVTPQAIVNRLRSKVKPEDIDAGIGSSGNTADVFDSEREARFLNDWVPSNLGKEFIRWITPQVPIDLIISKKGNNDLDRRADFMLYVPGRRPLIIEIDGEEHLNSRSDQERDKELADFEIKVFRIPNEEIDNLTGPKLSELKAECRNYLKLYEVDAREDVLAEALEKASWATKIQYGVLNAASKGQISLGKKNKLYISSKLLSAELIQKAIDDLNHLCAAYMELFSLDKEPFKQFSVTSSRNDADLVIGLYENDTQTTIAAAMRDEDVVICMGYAPIEFCPKLPSSFERPVLKVSDDEASKPLAFFLQSIFRKKSFREMQVNAICNALRGKDTITLLPTGAGKSIVYQLSGMLLPGATIVVDPIVALIDDQHLGLQLHGISRSAPIKMGENNQEKQRQDKMLTRIASGHFNYILISPERLLAPTFRDSLASMISQTPIDLAVIDEAHCVSQWGHDFRVAYLQLAQNLRALCSPTGRNIPTVLALTGTASRVVLKELVAELDIDADDQDAIIRPAHFDREELEFSIIRTKRGGKTLGELKQTLVTLPQMFGQDPETFFSSMGRATNSGIVFSPTVNGQTHRLLEIRDNVAAVINSDVGAFASTPPRRIETSDWNIQKQQSALSFKDNSSPALVATNAFGMGIDKPNIRWTIHMGLPSSLEAFYQEAGRAGRDRKRSVCSVIFSEVDPEVNDELLDPNRTLEDVRSLQANMKDNKDDVARALFFHLNSFSTVNDEVEMVKTVLEYGGQELAEGEFKVPFGREEATTEKAIARLIQCGIVRDYIIDRPKREFVVYSLAFDYQKSANKILNYVRKLQPALIAAVEKDIEKYQEIPKELQPLALCRMVIDFIYRIIEKSRRGMLREAVSMARSCDDNLSIRASLNGYFQEGLYAAKIADLAERESINFEDWLSVAKDLEDEFDNEEVKGASIRLLEAYPEHAGLLSLRAITESLANGGSETLIRNSLRAAFASAIERHLCSDQDVNDLIISLLELSKDRLAGIRNVLVDLLNPTEEQVFVPMQYVYDKLAEVSVLWEEKTHAAALQVITIYSISVVVPGLRRRVDSLSDVASKLREVN